MPRNFVYPVLALMITAFLAGCAGRKNTRPEPTQGDLPRAARSIQAESRRLAENQKALRQSLEKKTRVTPDLDPVLPDFNPLEGQLVSFSMVDENFKTVLYALAQAVGMNIIIDPAIDTREKPLTLHFNKTSADKVLKEILSIYDLYYTIDSNIIRIKPFQERYFSLNFLDTKTESHFDVGGDVLGEGDTEAASGLSGNFKLSGSSSSSGNPYETIQAMIQQLRSNNGKYNLNPASGTLYIKDTPAVIQAVAQMIDRIQQVLSQQVLIEARIIEVSLSDKYQYGINWEVVRDAAAAYSSVASASWSFGEGLRLSYQNSKVDTAMILDAIETFGNTKTVSNPIIRVKHGKPALISVGTSFTYKKSVETTTTGTGDDRTEETDIETSTVFDGLILGVIPFIEKNKNISLLINPIKSDVDRTSLNLESVGNGSQSIALPSVQIKEISTTISMHHRDVIVLGGLMDKYRAREDQGMPYISAVPVLGKLFQKEYAEQENRELVIILTVTII